MERVFDFGALFPFAFPSWSSQVRRCLQSRVFASFSISCLEPLAPLTAVRPLLVSPPLRQSPTQKIGEYQVGIRSGRACDHGG